MIHFFSGLQSEFDFCAFYIEEQLICEGAGIERAGEQCLAEVDIVEAIFALVDVDVASGPDGRVAIAGAVYLFVEFQLLVLLGHTEDTFVVLAHLHAGIFLQPRSEIYA